MPQPPTDPTEWRFPNRATPVGSTVYYAVRFSPAAQREPNARLIAWYTVVHEIADRPHDVGVARLKLDWWRDELNRLADGTPRHPLAKALHGCAVDNAAIPVMQAIIDAAEQRLHVPHPPDKVAFVSTCRQGLGHFFHLLAVLEGSASSDPSQCRELGGYCDAVECIRRSVEAPHKVPDDLSPATLEALPADARAARIDAVLRDFDIAEEPLGAVIPPFARNWFALTRAVHDKMRRKGYPVADLPVDRPPIAKLWTAWRCR